MSFVNEQSFGENVIPAEAPARRLDAGSSYVEMVGTAEDAGPYYLFSPGEPVYVQELRVGIPTIPAGQVLCLGNTHEWVDSRLAEGATGRQRKFVTPRDTSMEHIEREVPKMASTMRDSLMAMYGSPQSFSSVVLTEVTAFARQGLGPLDLGLFNQLIAPGRLEVGQVPADWSADVRTQGALLLRRRWAEQARDYFQGEESADLQAELRAIYLRAVDEILAAYDAYERFATAYLDAQDRAIQEKEKRGYDDRDRRMQWLLARQGVDTALTRALAGGQPQQIVVQMPEQAAPQAVDVAGIVEAAVKAALAAVQAQPASGQTLAAPPVVTETDASKPQGGPKPGQRR